MGSKQTTSLRVEELEQRTLLSAAPSAAVIAIAKQLGSEMLDLQRAADGLRLSTTTLMNNFEHDLSTGADTTADLQQLDLLTRHPPTNIINEFMGMAQAARGAPTLETELRGIYNGTLLLESVLKEEVQNVNNDLNSKLDPTKDLNQIESTVTYYDTKMDAATKIFLNDLVPYM